MNEHITFYDGKVIAECQTCLRTSNSLSPMSPEIINMYRKVVHEIENAPIICNICRYMFEKFLKFCYNCSEVSKTFENGGHLASKESFHYPNLTRTRVYHQPGPDSDGMTQDDPDIIDYEQQDCDDDEMPLMMLKNDVKNDTAVRRKRRKKKKMSSDNVKEIGQDYESGTNRKCKDFQDEKESVFSTRMVRETDEYVVIKLTKEQVLEEMREKSTSRVYLRSPYKCEKCVKGYNFEDVLNSHMLKHTTENGTFPCDICSQYCPSLVSLRGHMKSHTTRYKCKICGNIRLSRQHLLEHHSISHTSDARTYRCVDCDFTTNKRTVIQRHVKTHVSTERHACHHCGKLFKTIDSLRIHSVRHDKSRRYDCPECGKAFLYPSLLHKHVQAVHERDDYYCVECDVKFKSPETLRLHFKKAKRHRDDSSYKFTCPECPERFISESTLALHRSANHGVAVKRHSCDSCGRGYTTKDALRTHVWRTHAQTPRESPVCPLCHKTFSRNSIVKAHMRTHTGERPYACQCGAAFAQRATLRAHTASKHRQKQDIDLDEAKINQNVNEP